ncbi:methyltransferase, TIGR04325 family [Paraburkholderia sp. 40]|uniref:methyltransferase, TIGR04325 family n=1 Tax=unclassified Paraburkholderia TaxID=2615204 RepID=UPI003D1A1FEB
MQNMRTLSHLLSPAFWRSRWTAEFIGRYPSWSAALAAADGYDDPAILQKVHASALRVKQGEAAFERDSVCFEQEAFRWPLLGCLLHAAIMKPRNLHVVDFGGSLGSFYYQHKKFLQRIEVLQWSIVEQSNYVKVGRRDFEDDILKFYLSLGDAATRSAIDITLFSGSLQCVEDPFVHLQEAARMSKWIIIDRTPFIDTAQDRITVQRASIHKASYPHRFFSMQNFERLMNELGYTAICEWDGFDRAHIESRYLGRAYYASGRR